MNAAQKIEISDEWDNLSFGLKKEIADTTFKRRSELIIIIGVSFGFIWMAIKHHCVSSSTIICIYTDIPSERNQTNPLPYKIYTPQTQ